MYVARRPQGARAGIIGVETYGVLTWKGVNAILEVA